MNTGHKITLWLPKLGKIKHDNASPAEIDKLRQLDSDYFVTVCYCDDRNNCIDFENYFNTNILKRCSIDGCRYYAHYKCIPSNVISWKCLNHENLCNDSNDNKEKNFDTIKENIDTNRNENDISISVETSGDETNRVDNENKEKDNKNFDDDIDKVNYNNLNEISHQELQVDHENSMKNEIGIAKIRNENKNDNLHNVAVESNSNHDIMLPDHGVSITNSNPFNANWNDNTNIKYNDNYNNSFHQNAILLRYTFFI